MANGSGNEILLDQAYLDFELQEQAELISLVFSENSASFISINNKRLRVASLLELSGHSLGGVEIGVAIADSADGSNQATCKYSRSWVRFEQFSLGGDRWP